MVKNEALLTKVDTVQARRLCAYDKDGFFLSGSGGVTVAEEDVRGLETYYWQAPDIYTGNKLTSYGQSITVKTSWHKGRGDTAGTATLSPDIVIQVWPMT